MIAGRWQHAGMHRQILYRALGVGAVLVQYGCIAHCTLQFVADFVIVSINTYIRWNVFVWKS